MPGCALFFSEIGQLAHNAALGVAAICGHSDLSLSTISNAEPLRNVNPDKFVSAPDSDLLSAVSNVNAARPSAGRAGPDPGEKFSRLQMVILRQTGPQSLGGHYFLGNQSQARMAGLDSLTLYRSGYGAGLKASADAGQPSGNKHAELPKLADNLVRNDTDVSASAVDTSSPSIDLTNDEASVSGVEPGSGSEANTAPLGGLTVTGGYSSIEGISIGGEVVRKNILGPNSELSAAARYSKIRTGFELGHTDKNLAGTGLAFRSTLFANRLSTSGFGNGSDRTPFSQLSRGINIVFNDKFKNGLSVTANYRLSDDVFRMKGKGAICDTGIFGSPLCGEIGERTSSILSVALTFDERIRSVGKTHRFRLRLVHDLSIGGSAAFIRTRLSSEVHIGLGRGLNLSFGAEGGFIHSIGKDKIPLFERFYVGDSSMRGFDLRGIGPKVHPAAAPGQNVAIGGRIFYVTRTELSANLGGVFGAYGVQPSIFVDAGSVFAATKDALLPGEILTGNSAKPRVAVGIGIALGTPAGKLRFDFVRPLVKQVGDRAKLVSISFGTSI